MKIRIKGERKANREVRREQKKRLKPYKAKVKRAKSGWCLKLMLVFVVLALMGMGTVLGINAYIKNRVKDYIQIPEAASELQDVDCILVLGCLVKNSGEPSHMLEDRLKRAVELYHAGVAPKVLMSGDHGQTDYNEVQAMKQYAIEHGVPSEDVFMDHAGFSTYDSCYRARAIFDAKKIVIVTQEYHLYRALYIANSLGMEAYGVNADYRTYVNQSMRDAREVLARVKDFFYVWFRPDPKYLGEMIPISGNGDMTNDER